MHIKMLITAAAGAALALGPTAAVAQQQHPVRIEVRGHNKPPAAGHFYGHYDRRGAGHDHGVGGGDSAIWGGYDLTSSYDDSDWNGHSGNDWWNDRPDRAYPRWVQEQRARGTCEPDRMWWSGSGWHC